jgi:hypothetical protein
MSLESSRHISDSKRLLAVAGEGIGDRLGSVANGVRRLLGNALALVTAGAGSVTDLLACALLALCDALAGVDGRGLGGGTYQAGRLRQRGRQRQTGSRRPSGWSTSGSRG